MSTQGSSSAKKKHTNDALRCDTTANSGPDDTTDMRSDDELNENSDQDQSRGCRFDGSYVFTISGITQCITLVICSHLAVMLSFNSQTFRF